VPAATPLPLGAIAGGGALCALLLLAVLGAVYRRRIADRLGWSQRAKLRKHMQGLRSRSVQLALKRLSYITVDPKPGERAKAAAAAAAGGAVYRDADGRVIRNPMAGNPLQAAGLGADWKPSAAALAAGSAHAAPPSDAGGAGSGSGKEAEQQPQKQGAKEFNEGGKRSPLAPRGSTAGVADSKAGPAAGAAGGVGGSTRATLQLREDVAPVGLSDDPSAFSFAGPVSLSSAVRFSGPGLPGSGFGGDGSGGSGGDSGPFGKRSPSFRGGQAPGLAAAAAAAADMRRRWMHGGEAEEEGRGVAASAARAVQGAQHAAAARDSRLAFGPTAAKKGLLVKGGAKSARRPASLRMRGGVTSGEATALEAALSAANSASVAVVAGRSEGGGRMEAAEGGAAGDAEGISPAGSFNSSAAPSAASSRRASPAASVGGGHEAASRASVDGGAEGGEGEEEPIADGDEPTVLDVAAAAFLSLPAARRSLYVGAGAATAGSTPSNRPSMHASSMAAFYAGPAAGAAAGSASAVLPVSDATGASWEAVPAGGSALSGRAARVSLAVMGRGARASMAPGAGAGGGLLPSYGLLPVAAGVHAAQPGRMVAAAMREPSQETDDGDGEAW
jgi:hypothetical protein